MLSSNTPATNARIHRKYFEYFPIGQTVSGELLNEVLSMLVYKNVGEICRS